MNKLGMTFGSIQGNDEELKKIIEAQKGEIFYLKSIIEKLPGSIYWKDKNGIYLGCNDFVLQMAGVKDRQDIIGKTDFELPWKNYAHALRSIDEKVMQNNKSIEIEEYPVLANGQNTAMLTNKVPLRDELGDVIGVMGVSIDVTDRKRMEMDLKKAKEKAESASKAKSEFLENMRHDIRTPLSGIIGFAHVLKENIADPNIKQNVDDLITSSDALLNLLNEILEIIRINSEEAPTLKKKFDLKKKLQEVIDLNKSIASQKQLTLEFNYDDQIPQYLIGDVFKIHRIALELVTNALNFTDKGYIKLEVTLEKCFERELIIKLIVSDTGIGIAPKEQQTIFVQFNRLSPSYQGQYKGSGLGLSIVSKFMDDLGGEIYVESEPNQGSRFICFIPLKEALLSEAFGCEPENSIIKQPNEKDVEQQITFYASENNSAKMKSHILLVEDHAMTAKITEIILSNLSCHVDIAGNGHAALELFKLKHYDAIFMNIGLPDMDGFEVAKLIRLSELNNSAYIPIIAITAHVDHENERRCIEVGMNTVLSKPLTEEMARKILSQYIPAQSMMLSKQVA